MLSLARPAASERARLYEFGPYRIDTMKRLLLCGGQAVQVTSKAFDTLILLVENRGRLLEKAEMIEALWPDTFVEEINLTVHISALRKALGERPNEHLYIVTVPGHGYRFVAPVKEPAPAAEPASGYADRPRLDQSAESLQSIAVLPFTYISRGDDQYLGTGLASALVTRLSNIKQLLVRPFTAALRYTGEARNHMFAGRQLGVDVLLDGTIQKAGTRIRLTVQMVRASDGTILWADAFDEEFTNIFAVQDSISEQVVSALALKLSEEERKRLVENYTENAEAYNLYIKGRYFWEKRQQNDLNRSIECFKQAIALEPRYALAHAGLADSYTLLGEYLYLPPGYAFPRAKAAVLTALEMDSSLAEARATLADIRWFYDWKLAEAEAEFRRAIELRPAYATARHYYSWFLMMNGRLDEARAEINRALQLDPSSLTTYLARGVLFYQAGHYEKAVTLYREALDMSPGSAHARYYLGQALAECGSLEEAIEEFENLKDEEPTSQTLAMLGYCYGLSGNRPAALNILSKLRGLSKRRYISPVSFATVYAGLGEREEVFAFLEKAYEERSAWLAFLKGSPVFRRLRLDPRFHDLLRRMSAS